MLTSFHYVVSVANKYLEGVGNIEPFHFFLLTLGTVPIRVLKKYC